MAKHPKKTKDQIIAELTEALQRERADATNIRRQHTEQMAKLREIVKIDVIEQILPVIDHFELSLRHIPPQLKDDNFVKGVAAIVKQFAKTLDDIGVHRIQTLGQPFNPNLHEAISADDGVEIISHEVQSGYKIGDIVIRPAQVKLQKPTKP